MIEIAAAVCLMTEPNRCKDISLTYEPETMNIYGCAMYGQTELAKWSDEHPGWRVTRWSCGEAGRMSKL